MQTWRSAKRLQYRCFPVNTAKFLRTLLLQNSSTFCIMMKFSTKDFVNFFLTDWRHMGRKYTTEISSIINFFISPSGLKRLHGKISSRQSGIPAVQKRDPVLPRWNALHVIAGCNLWRAYNIAGILAKWDRISSWLTGIMWSPP